MNKTNKKLGGKTQSKVSKNVKVLGLSKQQEDSFTKMAEGCVDSLRNLTRLSDKEKQTLKEVTFEEQKTYL